MSTVSRGAAIQAKRQGQANAARRRPHKRHEVKHPGKTQRPALRVALRKEAWA
jgi:hypothetical protein